MQVSYWLMLAVMCGWGTFVAIPTAGTTHTWTLLGREVGERGHLWIVLQTLYEGKFWEFSWDEMARYDIPATIDKILEVTGKKSLFYIGHSMGTTTFMAMHHYRPDIASK